MKFIKESDLCEEADVVIEASSLEAAVQTGDHVLWTGESYAQGGRGRPKFDLPLVVMSGVDNERMIPNPTSDFKPALSLISEETLAMIDIITK